MTNSIKLFADLFDFHLHFVVHLIVQKYDPYFSVLQMSCGLMLA